MPSPQQQNRIYFLSALTCIDIPEPLLRGVHVLQVAANGSTQSTTLTLSEDKFTLSISTTTQTKGFFAPKTVLDRTHIDIGEMVRIQRGQSTQHFEKAKKKIPKKAELLRNTSNNSTASSTATSTASYWQQLDPQRSFSIIFRGADTLDIMADSPVARDVLCEALDRILNAYQRGKTRVAREILLLRYVWRGPAGLHQQHALRKNATQLQKVLQEINFVLKSKELQSAYDHFGKVIGLDRGQRRKGLTFEQSATFLHKIKRDSWMVKPVAVLWNELFGQVMNNGKMRTTVSDKTFLDKFVRGKQGDNGLFTLVKVRKLFRRLHDLEIAHTSSTEPPDPTRITKDQFEAYLYAAENDAFDPEKEKFDPSDMDQPLSEYWINTSHNTYLIGDQYTSHSSVEMYSKALYRGCRCLELDIWDGGKSPNRGTPIPVVWHGHTMTTKIRFEDILKTIKVFLNFHPDSFPIVLSFENHCSIPYQEVMAAQMVRIFGDALYVPTEASLFGKLPPPSQLRGMVVIKGRRPDGTEAESYDTDDDFSDDDGEEEDDYEPSSELKASRAKLVQKHGVAPQLARLTLFHGHKYKSFDESIRTPTYYMHSFSENKVRNLCRQKSSYRWIVHNQSHFSRTYPAGARVDSSNYNPLLAWCMGCQMVALNFQTEDHYLRLNDGRFRENGDCGYVLKPSSLMIKDDFSQTAAAVELSVRVLSGSCLPKPKGQRQGDSIDPYVKVAVYDIKDEEKETTSVYQTDVVPQNGFFPIWRQEEFQFSVENWAVAMLQLTVYDKSRGDEFIGSSSIPISCLRGGIRSVKLYDASNSRSGAFDFAALLCDIQIGHVVAEI